jgi:hypothetical protein
MPSRTPETRVSPGDAPWTRAVATIAKPTLATGDPPSAGGMRRAIADPRILVVIAPSEIWQDRLRVQTGEPL